MHRTPTEGTIKAVNRDTDTEDGVDLHLGDADDKFGFGDGDIFEEWVRAWAHQAWPSHTEGIDLDDPDDHVWPYLDDRRILDHVVTHKLIPRLAPDLAQHISTFGTIHNPIRFDPPDEREDDTEWQQRAVDEMNSISAHVSRSEIYRLCDELYPPRDRSWLALYNELTW